MNHAKLEITKTKHQGQAWKVLEMHLMMTTRNLWISQKIRIQLKRQRRYFSPICDPLYYGSYVIN